MTSSIDTTPTTAELEWGVRVTLPAGAPSYEPHSGPAAAESAAERMNRLLGHRTVVVWREVTRGPWTSGAAIAGTEFGVRHRWDDGHTEIDIENTRYGAEWRVRTSHTAAELVARQVEAGPWQIANRAADRSDDQARASRAAVLPIRSARPHARRMWPVAVVSVLAPFALLVAGELLSVGHMTLAIALIAAAVVGFVFVLRRLAPLVGPSLPDARNTPRPPRR